MTLHRLSCRLADLVLWRDQRSRTHLGIGDTTPDIGFAADLRGGLPWDEREILVVTLRGKRSVPPKEWFDDLAHEELLRDLYGQARAVISDRLHVLILSSLSGTVPVELVENPAEKVRIHREQRGVPAVSVDARGLSGAHVVSALEDVIQAGPPTTAVKAAHESLAQWRDRVRVLSLERRSTR